MRARPVLCRSARAALGAALGLRTAMEIGEDPASGRRDANPRRRESVDRTMTKAGELGGEGGCLRLNVGRATGATRNPVRTSCVEWYGPWRLRWSHG